jgi:two-component system nitrogen regulation response regulator GlnG/two-component system response regulator HydG
MVSDSSTQITRRRSSGATRLPPPALSLVIVWSRSEPQRIGEIAMPLIAGTGGDDARHLGRGDRDGGLCLIRQRPGHNDETGPLAAPGISRQQWRIRAGRTMLGIENVGRREMLHNGVSTGRAQARGGHRPSP